MVKKLKTLAKSEDKQLASAVRTSAHQIWQAGLGAFAKAQEEGGRVFSKLVKEGTELQNRTKKMAEDKVSDVTGTVSKVAEGVGKQASGSWDKLEQVFEDRVARALGSIGVPTQKDIHALTKRVEQLSKAVLELGGKKSAPVKPVPKSTPKSAAKAVLTPAAKKAGAKPAVKAAAKGSVNFPTAASVKSVAPAANKPAARKRAPKKPAPAAVPLADPATPIG